MIEHLENDFDAGPAQEHAPAPGEPDPLFVGLRWAALGCVLLWVAVIVVARLVCAGGAK